MKSLNNYYIFNNYLKINFITISIISIIMILGTTLLSVSHTYAIPGISPVCQYFLRIGDYPFGDKIAFLDITNMETNGSILGSINLDGSSFEVLGHFDQNSGKISFSHKSPIVGDQEYEGFMLNNAGFGPAPKIIGGTVKVPGFGPNGWHAHPAALC
jgi:hypothetical protein